MNTRNKTQTLRLQLHPKRSLSKQEDVETRHKLGASCCSNHSNTIGPSEKPSGCFTLENSVGKSVSSVSSHALTFAALLTRATRELHPGVGRQPTNDAQMPSHLSKLAITRVQTHIT
eukprot:582659-Amphidinium_carterae.1